MGKTKQVTDYMDKMQQAFPDVDPKVLKHVMTYGLKSLYYHNLYGGDVCICTQGKRFSMFFGFFFREFWYMYWRRKWRIKLRVLYYRHHKNKKFNGWYYFGMTEEDNPKVVNYDARSKGRDISFGPVVFYKILNEAMLKKSNMHFYAIHVKFDCGMWFKLDNLKTTKAIYLGKRKPGTDFEIEFNKGIKWDRRYQILSLKA